MKPHRDSDIVFFRNDEFLPVIFFAINIIKHKAIWNIWFGTFIFMLVFVLWQTCLLLKAFNAKHFVQYAPFYFISSFMDLSILVMVMSFKAYSTHWKQFKSEVYWSFKMASSNLQLKIQRECKILQFIYCIGAMLAFFLVLMNICNWISNNERYFVISPIINTYFPAYSHTIHVVIQTCGLLTTIPMTTSPWYSIYVTTYLKFQLYLLCECVQNITNKCENESLKVCLEDESFQNKISSELKFCISRHQELLMHHNLLKTIDEDMHLNMLFIFGSFLVGFYTVFTIFSENFSWHITVLACITFGFLALFVCANAQVHEDVSDTLADIIYNLRWYSWSNENMKLLRMFHLYTSKVKWRIPLSSFIFVNLNLFKKLGKVMYSVAGIFHSKQS